MPCSPIVRGLVVAGLAQVDMGERVLTPSSFGHVAKKWVCQGAGPLAYPKFNGRPFSILRNGKWKVSGRYSSSYRRGHAFNLGEAQLVFIYLAGCMMPAT